MTLSNTQIDKFWPATLIIWAAAIEMTYQNSHPIATASSIWIAQPAAAMALIGSASIVLISRICTSIPMVCRAPRKWP